MGTTNRFSRGEVQRILDVTEKQTTAQATAGKKPPARAVPELVPAQKKSKKQAG